MESNTDLTPPPTAVSDLSPAPESTAYEMMATIAAEAATRTGEEEVTEEDAEDVEEVAESEDEALLSRARESGLEGQESRDAWSIENR